MSYYRELSVEGRVAARRAERIEFYRAFHETDLLHGFVTPSANRLSVSANVVRRDDSGREYIPLPDSRYKDVLGREEDRSCPFCPPYSLSLDTQFDSDNQPINRPSLVSDVACHSGSDPQS